tara:strand:+ start:3583 stop:4161 length:579 start_codon:yes stop_codon:yes gene_type:complete
MSDSSYYNRKFVENMKNIHDYEPEDFENFICIGSSETHTKIPYCWRRDVIIPPITDECVCTKKIRENCWIMNKENGEVLVIGNHCVKRFLKKENRKLKRCMGCGDPCLKRTSEFCDICVDKFAEYQKKQFIKEYKKKQQKIKVADENGTLYKFCIDCNKYIYKPGMKYIYCYNCKIKNDDTTTNLDQPVRVI